MDFQTGFNLVLGVCSAVGIPLLQMIFSRMKEAQAAASQALGELQAYKTHVAENYVSLKRFDGFEERLFDELKAIKDKLDAKADK